MTPLNTSKINADKEHTNKSAITGTDRLNAALRGDLLDRIGLFCNMFDQGAKELGLSIQDYYSKGEYVAEGQIKMREKYGYDNVWAFFYVGKEAEVLGCKSIIFSKDGPPNVADFIVKGYDDIKKLQIPDNILDNLIFQEELKCLNILKKEVGGKYPICVYITSSMGLPIMLMGMEKWLELLFMGDADARDELLIKCSDFAAKQLNAYRDAGADVFVYSNPFGSTDIISMKFFKEVSLPWMERDLKDFGTKSVVYYCGGYRFNNLIDAVIDRLGFKAFYLSPFDDIAQAKKIIAGRGVTCGVMNDIPLIDFKESQIRAEVKRIIDAGMEGGKFVFGTLGMPYNIPEKNIRIMVESVCEYGRNPSWR